MSDRYDLECALLKVEDRARFVLAAIEEAQFRPTHMPTLVEPLRAAIDDLDRLRDCIRAKEREAK